MNSFRINLYSNVTKTNLFFLELSDSQNTTSIPFFFVNVNLLEFARNDLIFNRPGLTNETNVAESVVQLYFVMIDLLHASYIFSHLYITDRILLNWPLW